MAFCIQCGAKLPENAKFCPSCGAKLSVEAAEVPSAVQEFGTIVFARQQSEYLAGAASSIFIDKIHITDIYVSMGTKVKVVPGRHIIDISIDVFHTMLDVNVEAEGTVYVSHYLEAAEEKKKSQIVVSDKPVESITSYTSFNATRDDVIKENATPQKKIEGMKCPECGGPVNFQTVTETGAMGCGAIGMLSIVVLALLFFVPVIAIIIGVVGIVALARGSNETVTYAVCQICGHKERQ